MQCVSWYEHQIHQIHEEHQILAEADLCFYNGGTADEKCHFLN